MKKLLIILLCLPMIGFGQRRYNPDKDINLNLTITIKEPYKPIDYSKIFSDFNDAVQAEVQRRERLKRYYDNVAMQTKSSILNDAYLTSDNNLNSLILKLQNTAIKHIDRLNNYLKRGLIKPTKYENAVRNGYYNFINLNQSLLFILQYKHNKLSSLENQNLISDYQAIFIETLKSISKFTFNEDKNCIYFYLEELLYLGEDMHKSEKLYDFIIESANGSFDKFANDYKLYQKRKIDEKNNLKIRVDKLVNKRNEYIKNLTKKEKKRFLKSELKYLSEYGTKPYWIIRTPYYNTERKVKKKIKMWQEQNYSPLNLSNSKKILDYIEKHLNTFNKTID